MAASCWISLPIATWMIPRRESRDVVVGQLSDTPKGFGSSPSLSTHHTSKGRLSCHFHHFTHTEIEMQSSNSCPSKKAAELEITFKFADSWSRSLTK